MDPELCAYLDRLDSNANDRAAAADAKYDSIIERLDAQTARIDSLADWKRELEARFAKLELSVASLQAASTMPASSKGPPSAFPTAAAGDTPGQSSHGVPLHPGGIPSVTLASPVPSPVTGMSMIPSPISSPLSSQVLNSLGQAPPLMTFPVFAGENPQLWKTLCEQYFQMFTMHESYWVPMAILNFSGTAAIWLQSVQRKITGLNWESFTALLCTRFGRISISC